MSRTATLVAAFAVTLGLVLGVAAVAPMVAGDAREQLPEIENPQYTDEDLRTDVTPGNATIAMESDEGTNSVLIEAGPGVSERDVRPLVNALTDGGHTVRVHGTRGGPIRPPASLIPTRRVATAQRGGGSGEETPLSEDLAEADAFVSVGATDYDEADIEALGNFTDNGGRVLLATNPRDQFGTDLGGAALQSELGVATESGYVYNLAENDMNYLRTFASPATDDGLTEGVDRVVFPSATPVTAPAGDTLARAIEGSQLSTTRDDTDAGMLVRTGNVVLAGDTGFMTPENTQRVDNDVLVGNLADFLVTGDRERPETGERDGQTAATRTVTVGPGGDPVFEPRTLRIEPGTTVRFVWDSGGHNLAVTRQPDGAEWNGVPEIRDEGYVHNHTFRVEGVYEFASEPSREKGMVGRILVGPPPGEG